MKVIYQAPDRTCRCDLKNYEHLKEGSVVRCDCGIDWLRHDRIREYGFTARLYHWRKVGWSDFAVRRRIKRGNHG